MYVGFFIDILPMFFANMESANKNVLAVFIVICTIYVLLNIVFKLDNKIDRYLILGLYLLVLVIGLLRPDHQYFGETGGYSWNPFGFIFDIQGDTASLIVMIVNIIIFLPFYFLLLIQLFLVGFYQDF
ncbi:hypothetical protein JOE23_002982 [Amphibacillus cookii]|nr:hypothetical protein [Amphibacillus cookii]